MNDYKPIDLSRWCNEGTSVLGEGQDVGIGRQTFLGLPFLMGADGGKAGDKCFIALGGSDSSVTIPINQRARRVIVAHRLLEYDMSSGRSPGAQVAEYVFGLSGDRQERVPIRDGFEISAVAGEASIRLGIRMVPFRRCRASTLH